MVLLLIEWALLVVLVAAVASVDIEEAAVAAVVAASSCFACVEPLKAGRAVQSGPRLRLEITASSASVT